MGPVMHKQMQPALHSSTISYTYGSCQCEDSEQWKVHQTQDTKEVH